MHRLNFSIKTLSPVVLSSNSNPTVMTETHLTFSGSIIRGVLASRFVEVNRLGAAAHADENFREIFYGGLKFLPANPEIFGARAFVLPNSLQRGKDGTKNAAAIQDLLTAEKPPRGYKTFRGLAVLRDGKFFSAKVKKNIFMHMSRSSEKERLAGRSVDGLIYNYESIDAGQNFRGEILGEENLLRKLLDGLNLVDGKLVVYVGRSRFTQYGKCLVTFGDVEKISPEKFPDTCCLRLDTPLIPAEDCLLSAKKILQRAVVDTLGKNISLGKVFASCVEIENFVVPWSMKRPRVMALAAGSVFELNLDDDAKKILAEKIFHGFGTRTEEGFGQLRLWTPSNDLTLGKRDDEISSRPEKFSDATISRAKKILKAHLLEQVRLYAHADADTLRPQLRRENFTHFFTRLDKILSVVDKKNLRENFKIQLESELRDGSLFKDHLKSIHMTNGQKLYDVLTCLADFPRDVRSLMDGKQIKKFRGEIAFDEKDFSDDDFFYEYLKNYFRFARKIAADEGRRDS